MAVDREEGEDGVEGFGDHKRAEDDEEGAGKDLEVDELRRRAEAGVQGSDVSLVG